jgi:hypothetical protein
MLELNDLKLIGKFGVDSGQAMVGDPCYLEEWKPWDDKTQKFEEYVNHKGEYSYLGACEATITKGYGNIGGAVAFSTGYGDGYYPVFAQINDDGRVMKIVIDFEGDINDDGELEEQW